MFKDETLLILGAGASWNYGYPLGHDLIKKIITNINSDQLYIPASYMEVGKTVYKLSTVIKYMSSLKEENEFSQFVLNNTLPVKLNRIDEFRELKEALEQFDPVSIDAFLNHHQSYALAGKIMIVYTLLDCENPQAFNLNYKLKDERGNKVEADNWYRYLIYDLLSGCQKAEDIVQNKLKIITFNYDLSLDYVLKQRLLNVELLKENEVAKQYVDKLVDRRTKHIYGKLYDDNPIEVYGGYNKRVSIQYEIDGQNTKRLVKAIKSESLIKLMNEDRRGDIKSNAAMIKEAKKIIIIGFGFDRDNLDRLGFPSNWTDYGEFFSGKQILFMDYDGKMRALADQFSSLVKSFGFTRSVSTRISDAYQNDFKIRLY